MRRLIEELEKFAGPLVEARGARPDDFFSKGILPDGSKWRDTPKLFFAAGNTEPTIKKAKPTNQGGIIHYSADVDFAPGKGGGGGISIDPTASNQYFNMVGTGRKQIKAFGSAMQKAAKRNSRTINAQIEQYFRKEFFWRVVGYEKRNKYVVSDVTFRKIDYRPADVDPTRRRWPSGRTEAWMPVKTKVMMVIKPKGV